MTCPCGGDTTSVTLERDKLEASLMFQQCRQCGRIGKEFLILRNEVVNRDWPARQAFNSLTNESVTALWQEHQAAKAMQLQQAAAPARIAKPMVDQMALFE